MSKSVIRFLVTWTTSILKFSSTIVGYAILREILRRFLGRQSPKGTLEILHLAFWFMDIQVHWTFHTGSTLIWSLSYINTHSQGQIGWYTHKNIITQPVVSFKSLKIQKKFLKLSYAELAYLDWIRLSSSRETQRKLMEKEATCHFLRKKFEPLFLGELWKFFSSLNKGRKGISDI